MYDTNRTGRNRALFFCSTLLLGSLSNVHGQGTTNAISKTKVTIPEIVVTATRDQRLVKDVPYSTSIFDANTLRLETPVRKGFRT